MDNRIKKPSLILAATPNEAISLQNFFQEKDNRLFQLLKDPPYLRYSGWNMLTLDFPKIKEGNSWYVSNGGRKDIQLYEDLSLVSRVDATEEFLGWGNNNAKFQDIPLLNTLAVIEFCYEFVEVYKRMLQSLEKKPRSISFGISLFNTTLANGKKLRLKSHKVTDIFYFIDDGTEIDKDFKQTKEVLLNDAIYDSRYVAFELVAVIFNHFNISNDKIPYSALDDKGKTYIDLTTFKTS